MRGVGFFVVAVHISAMYIYPTLGTAWMGLGGGLLFERTSDHIILDMYENEKSFNTFVGFWLCRSCLAPQRLGCPLDGGSDQSLFYGE
jgi:hypothetical protein